MVDVIATAGTNWMPVEAVRMVFIKSYCWRRMFLIVWKPYLLCTQVSEIHFGILTDYICGIPKVILKNGYALQGHGQF